MSLETSEDAQALPRRRWTVGLASTSLAICASGAFFACSDDVGQCCSVLDPALADRIPTATTTRSGSPTSDIALDPAFDCDSLVCVAFQGSEPYCTERCFEDGDCPEDFVCRSVLAADPGPEANIRPGDRFCVKDLHVCSE